MISDTTYQEMLNRWRKARLSADTEALGFPKISILVKALEGRGGRVNYMPDDALSDADIMQTIVNTIPDALKAVYEAKHICLIRGQRCIGMPHEGRANILGIAKSTYWRRFEAATTFVKKELQIVLDK